MSKKPIHSDLDRIDAQADDDIDYTDIEPLDEAFFARAEVVVPPGKKAVSLRIDEDVLAWMKSQGKGYQSRINAILRAYYEAHHRPRDGR